MPPRKDFSDDLLPLRKEIGRRHKELRERRGLSQSQMQALLGINQPNFISQIEIGIRKVPGERYEAWASALGVDLRDFVQLLMKFYDPLTYVVLFGSEDPYNKMFD